MVEFAVQPQAHDGETQQLHLVPCSKCLSFDVSKGLNLTTLLLGEVVADEQCWVILVLLAYVASFVHSVLGPSAAPGIAV